MTVIAPHRQPIANTPTAHTPIASTPIASTPIASTPIANTPIANTYEAPVLQAVARVDPREAQQGRFDEARRAGFEAGYAAGQTRAEAEIVAVIHHHNAMRDRFVQAAVALQAATDELARRDAVALEAIEIDVIALAIALATDIIDRELTVTPHPVRDALARALRLVPDRGIPVARVHPDDAEVAREVLRDDARWAGTVEVVTDVRVEPGGCVLEIGECRIDAQIAPALDRLRNALSNP